MFLNFEKPTGFTNLKSGDEAVKTRDIDSLSYREIKKRIKDGYQLCDHMEPLADFFGTVAEDGEAFDFDTDFIWPELKETPEFGSMMTNDRRFLNSLKSDYLKRLFIVVDRALLEFEQKTESLYEDLDKEGLKKIVERVESFALDANQGGEPDAKELMRALAECAVLFEIYGIRRPTQHRLLNF